ncbi:MAG: hypothetical protein P8K66_09515 [Planctomycetota bacterium]|nr:hypothetical protein [Planctomycetota bacterium]
MESLEARKQSQLGWLIFVIWIDVYLLIDLWLPMLLQLIPWEARQHLPQGVLRPEFWITDLWLIDVDNLGHDLAYSGLPYLWLPLWFLVFYVAPTILSVYFSWNLFNSWKNAGS